MQKMKMGQKSFQEEIKMLQLKKREDKANLMKTLKVIEAHSNRLIQNIKEIQAKDKLRNELKQNIDIDINQKAASTSQTLKKVDWYKYLRKERSLSKDDDTFEERWQKMFEDRQKSKISIQKDLKMDEELKGQALNFLLNEREQQHRMITEQINLIESELFVLTRAEIQKKNQNLDTKMADLSQQRITLAFLLGELIEEKEKKLTKQTSISNTSGNHSQSYAQQLKEIYLFDEYLYRLVLSCDQKSIQPYLGLFLDQKLTFERLIKMNDKDMFTIGIDDYHVVDMLINGSKVIAEESLNIATAPELDQIEEELEPSAPPLTLWYQIECSICLDLKVSSTFTNITLANCLRGAQGVVITKVKHLLKLFFVSLLIFFRVI